MLIVLVSFHITKKKNLPQMLSFLNNTDLSKYVTLYTMRLKAFKMELCVCLVYYYQSFSINICFIRLYF